MIIFLEGDVVLPEARLLKNFRFRVFTDSTLQKEFVACSEISGGFESKYSYATYRPGNAPTSYPLQIICGASPSNITFKYGMTSSENMQLCNWVLSTTTSESFRYDKLTVVLYKDDGKTPGAKWEIKNAYPVSCKGPNLNANVAEIAFEEIEICHEGFQRISLK